MKKILLITTCLLAVNTMCRAQQSTGQKNDAIIYRQLEQLAGQMNPNTENSTLSGAMRIVQPGVSAKQQHVVPLLFSRRGNSFYYRLGDTETLNEQGFYIYIDHKAKQVLVSAQKKVVMSNQLSAMADIAAKVKEEDYQPEASVNGKIRTIRFVNERHPSCKEYAIAFDKATMAIKSVFIRLADPYDQEGLRSGQTVQMQVKEWRKTADLSAYLTPAKVFTRTGGNMKLTAGFKNYRLTKI